MQAEGLRGVAANSRPRLPCCSRMRYWDAVFAFVVAMVVATVLTPLAARLARRVGAIAMPSERGLAERATPLLGGLAILAGVLQLLLLEEEGQGAKD